MVVIDYCNMSAEQYNAMTAEFYDTMIDCDGDDEGPKHRSTSRSIAQGLVRVQPFFRPVLAPLFTLEELEDLMEGGMV